ncbi:MAG TPA: hypothetical protein VML75_24320 [Kofleriaceae bacterium]|nr:hypothetical protein [Kofleriaceae bacterium]
MRLAVLSVAMASTALTACGHLITKRIDNIAYVEASPDVVAVQIERAAPDFRHVDRAPHSFEGTAGQTCSQKGTGTRSVCTRKDRVSGLCVAWGEAIIYEEVCRTRVKRILLQPLSASWCADCTTLLYSVEGHLERADWLLADDWFRRHRPPRVPGLHRRLTGMGTYLETPATIYFESLQSDVASAPDGSSDSSRVRIAPIEFRVGGGKFDFHAEALELMSPARTGHPWIGTWIPSIGVARALLRRSSLRFSIGYSGGLYNDGVPVDTAVAGESILHQVHGLRHGPIADLVVFPMQSWNLALRLSARYTFLFARHDATAYSDAGDPMSLSRDESGSGRRAQVRLYAHAPIGLKALAITAGVQLAWTTYDYPSFDAVQGAIAPFVGIGFGW